MQNGQKPGEQCEQLQAYIADARKAQELLQASLQAITIEFDAKHKQACRTRDVAMELATANFEIAQSEIDDLYNAATQPHTDVLHRACDSAKASRDLAIAVARAAYGVPENSSIDELPFGPERDCFEKEMEVIVDTCAAAFKQAEEAFQLVSKPIKAVWEFASKQNKAAFEKAERRAHAAYRSQLRRAMKLCQKKDAATRTAFRVSREQRMAIWQQYLAGNEHFVKQQ